MFKSPIYDEYMSSFENIIRNAFMNIKVELINFVLNFITIMFYVFIFGTIFNQQVSSYLQFIIPGLILFNILASVSYQNLKLWSLGSAAKLMNYWLSLPMSLPTLLLSFTVMAVINTFFYVLPLILLSVIFHFSLNIGKLVIIVILSSIFLFLIMFILVLYLFKTNSFIIVFNVAQPLMLRISPIFYPLIYLPVFSLPLVFLNPITWIVETLRSSSNTNFLLFLTFFTFIDLVLFKVIITYWTKKIKTGELC